MLHRKTLILTSCLAIVALSGCECLKAPAGKYDDTIAEDQVAHKIWLTKDGTVMRVETLNAGNWEKGTTLSGKPGLGAKVVDIKIWLHDGTLKDVKVDDGTQFGKQTHPHAAFQT